MFAREESHQRAARVRDVIADRAAEDRILIFERIEDRPLRHGTGDIDAELPVDIGQRA